MGHLFFAPALLTSARHVPLMRHHDVPSRALPKCGLRPAITSRLVLDGRRHDTQGPDALFSGPSAYPQYPLVLGLSSFSFPIVFLLSSLGYPAGARAFLIQTFLLSSSVLCSTCPRFPFASELPGSCRTCIYSSTPAVPGPHLDLLSYWAR